MASKKYLNSLYLLDFMKKKYQPPKIIEEEILVVKGGHTS